MDHDVQSATGPGFDLDVLYLLTDDATYIRMYVCSLKHERAGLRKYMELLDVGNASRSKKNFTATRRFRMLFNTLIQPSAHNRQNISWRCFSNQESLHRLDGSSNIHLYNNLQELMG